MLLEISDNISRSLEVNNGYYFHSKSLIYLEAVLKQVIFF